MLIRGQPRNRIIICSFVTSIRSMSLFARTRFVSGADCSKSRGQAGSGSSFFRLSESNPEKSGSGKSGSEKPGSEVAEAENLSVTFCSYSNDILFFLIESSNIDARSVFC